MPAFAPVYLLRKGNSAYLARRFLTSFFRFDPGEKVSLILLLKGFEPDEMPDELATLARDKRARIKFTYVNDLGMDLTAYRALCQQRTERHFLFFNSNSVILNISWFEAFNRALSSLEGKGLIGASGSYEAQPAIGLEYPNPHIRTNGFLVGREDYLEASNRLLITKNECHLFESGPNSLTRYFMDKGDPILIVNSDLQRFEVKDWPKSQTFRLGDQQKLLIADNRSEKYHTGLAKRRQFHGSVSWGEEKDVMPIHWAKIMKRILWGRLSAGGHRIPLVKSLIENRILR